MPQEWKVGPENDGDMKISGTRKVLDGVPYKHSILSVLDACTLGRVTDGFLFKILSHMVLYVQMPIMVVISSFCITSNVLAYACTWFGGIRNSRGFQ